MARTARACRRDNTRTRCCRRGARCSSSIFPGFKDELLGQGALRGSYQSVRWFDNGVYHTRFDGLEALLVSRPCLEAHVRTPACGVAERAPHRPRRCRIARRRQRERDGRQRALLVGRCESAHDADLVVDASGRGSQSPAWLERMGFPRPQEDAVRVGLGYTTRMYRRKSRSPQGRPRR